MTASPADPARVPAAVLFDMDGTLVDTEPYWIEAEYRLVAEFGGTWSDEHAHALVGNALIASAEYLRDVGGVELDPPGDRRAAARRRRWRQPARDAVAARRARPAGRVPRRGRAVRDGDDVLRAAGAHAWSTPLPPGTFATVVTGDQVTRGKPAPRGLRDRLRAPRRATRPTRVAIEDSPTGRRVGRGRGLRRCSPCRTTSPSNRRPDRRHRARAGRRRRSPTSRGARARLTIACRARSATCCPRRRRCSACPAAEDRLRLAARLGAVRRVARAPRRRHGPAAAAGDGPPHAPLLAAALAAATPGTSTSWHCEFPSTTPTSLVSLGTGARPGAHGVLGFTVRVPGTGRVLTHITWRDDPPPARWQPLPTWFERVGRPPGVAGPRRCCRRVFAGSGLTDAAYRGAAFARCRQASRLRRSALSTEVAGRPRPGLRLHRRARHRRPRARHRLAAVAARPPRGVDTPAEPRARGPARRRGAAGDRRPRRARTWPATHGVDVDADARLRAGVVVGRRRAAGALPAHPARRERPTCVAAWRGVLGAAAAGADPRRRDRPRSVRAGARRAPRAHRRRGGHLHRRRWPCWPPATNRPRSPGWSGFHGALRPEETAIPLLRVRRLSPRPAQGVAARPAGRRAGR